MKKKLFVLSDVHGHFTAMKKALDEAGFDLCGMYADFDFSPVTESTERWYVVARTRKVGDWYLCEGAR